MQAPTAQQVPSVSIGSRLADDPTLGGSRQGEAAGAPVHVKPRPERHSFQSPLYRKAYFMQPATNATLEMQHAQRFVQVNNLDLNTWTHHLEKRTHRFYVQSPKATAWFQGVDTRTPIDIVQIYIRDTFFRLGTESTLHSVHYGASPLWTMSPRCELQQARQPQHSGGSVAAYVCSW